MLEANACSGVLSAAGAEVVEDSGLGLVYRLPAASVRTALEALKRSDLGFVMLADLLGVDTGEAIDVVYQVRSFDHDTDVFLKAELAYDAALVSVWDIFPSALSAEREVAELFGLRLTGHPNPKRMLTTDAVGPLLRKSVEVRTLEEVRDR